MTNVIESAFDITRRNLNWVSFDFKIFMFKGQLNYTVIFFFLRSKNQHIVFISYFQSKDCRQLFLKRDHKKSQVYSQGLKLGGYEYVTLEFT